MSESKHTPGPWEWRKCGDSWLLWGFHGMRPIILDVGQVRGVSRNRRILRMRDDGIMVEASSDHPDARLIAASPDLLAACEALLPYATACIGLPRESWPADSVILQAEAAITKAKGGA